MTPATRATRSRVTALPVLIALVLNLVAGPLAPVIGAAPSPVQASGHRTVTDHDGAANQTCFELGSGDYDGEYKLDSKDFLAGSNVYVISPSVGSIGDLTITINFNAAGNAANSFTFSGADKPILAVFVKGGQGESRLYEYDTPVTADATPLTTQHGGGISHVSFCVSLLPDITVTKTAAASPIDAGATASFGIVVKNIGLVKATGVVLTDSLPIDGNWTVGGADAGSCSIAGTLLTCTFGDLDAGQEKSISLSRVTTAANCGTITNIANVSATNEKDAQKGNNSSTASIVVVCRPDVVVTKSASQSTVLAPFSGLVYTLTAENIGNTAATGVVVTDDLDDDLTNVTATWSVGATSGNCTIGALNAISCAVGTLAASDGAPGGLDTAVVTITVDVPVTACPSISNRASVAATNEGQGQTGNNLSQTVVVTVNCPDASVVKTATAPSIDAGDTASYAIGVSGGTLGTNSDVVLTDVLPTGFSWTVAGADVAACKVDGLAVINPVAGGKTLICNFGSLDANESKQISLSAATTAANCEAEISNTATIAVDGDTNAANNTSTATITVKCPDLHTTKSSSKASLLAPDSLTYTITVTNDGNGLAESVNVTDLLDEHLVITSATFDVNPGVAGGEGACSFNNTTKAVSCDVGDLAASDGVAGGPDTVVVTIQVTVPVAACGQLTNVASASAANESASDAADNDSDQVMVDVDCPDVSVTKTADEPQIDAGGIASFTIGVDGGEFGTNSDVILTDVLPAGLSWTVGGDTEDCTVDAGAVSNPVAGGKTLICNFGELDANETKEITLSANTTTANCEAKIRNDASIAVDGDTNEQNDSDWDEITVFCPDVSITKEGGDPVNAGEEATFTITITVGGTGTSNDVELTDDLIGAKADWTFEVTEGADDTACSINDDPKLFCDFGDLDAPKVITIELTYKTDFADCDEIENSATVSSTNDTDPTNNELEEPATVTVNCPDLGLVKEADTDVVSAGDKIGFTIEVSNDGPGDALNVYLEDDLPSGNGAFDWEIAADSEDEGACSIGLLPSGGQQLVCEWETFGIGSLTIHVVSETSSEACDSWLNSVILSATNGPPDVLRSSDTVTVNCPDVTVNKKAVETPISAGDQGRFTLEVSNAGPGSAYNLVVEDTAPIGTVWTVLDDGDFHCTDDLEEGQQTITCTLEQLDAEDSATILIGYTTSTDDCGVLDNRVNVSAGNEPDENTADNSDDALIVVECPLLNLTKIAAADPIDAGDEASFTITLWNAGPGDAFEVELHDDLPPGLAWDFEIVSGDADEDDCEVASSVVDGGIQQMSIDCDFGTVEPTSMEGGIVIRVFADTDRTDCGLLTNTATADGSNLDEPLTRSDSIMVKCPEVEIVKTNNQPNPVLPGANVTFTLDITVSDGPAEDVVVVDTLPAGYDAPTNISHGGTYAPATRTITWSLGNLATGGYERTYQAAVSAGVAHGALLVNVAIVTSSNSQCPNAASLAPECDDDSTVTVRVPTLVIDKVASTETITITGPSDALVATPSVVTWTLSYTLTNGPVTGAVITDPVPAGFTFLDASNGGTFVDGTVTWNLGTLSASGSVTFRTTVNPATISRTGPTVNTATIHSNETSPDSGQDSVTVVVEAPPLGGNPTPTPAPLPDTATGGEPTSLPILLLLAFLMASVGALTMPRVENRTRHW